MAMTYAPVPPPVVKVVPVYVAPVRKPKPYRN
jgi:hypothetical protein